MKVPAHGFQVTCKCTSPVYFSRSVSEFPKTFFKCVARKNEFGGHQSWPFRCSLYFSCCIFFMISFIALACASQTQSVLYYTATTHKGALFKLSTQLHIYTLSDKTLYKTHFTVFFFPFVLLYLCDSVNHPRRTSQHDSCKQQLSLDHSNRPCDDLND